MGKNVRTATYWQDMKVGHNKHDVKKFPHDLKALGKMIRMSDKEVLEHFKEVFPTKIEAQLLEINDTRMVIGKVRVLILLLRNEIP